MKRLKVEPSTGRRFKLFHLLLGVAALYLVFLASKFHHFLEIAATLSGDDSYFDTGEAGLESDLRKPLFRSAYVSNQKLEENQNEDAPNKEPTKEVKGESEPLKPTQQQYGRITGEILRRLNRTSDMSSLERMADEAWTLGLKAWQEMLKYKGEDIGQTSSVLDGKAESCPLWLSMSGEELDTGDAMVFLPCGLAAGSSITVIGKPHYAHPEFVPQLARLRHGDGIVLVSQFVIELQGLKAVDGEDPPKILHLNPRLKGDWSKRPVIEHNTCYRMQWGTAQRCDGFGSKKDEDMMVDGYVRCEKWMRRDVVDSKESKTTSWFKRFIGREQKPDVTWSFPFVEGRLFILTLRAGVDGYHINVGGRHVTSFPYRTGFTLEDATGLAIKGDVDIQSVYATSLPNSHPSFSPQRVLEMSEKWKARPIPKTPIWLFIGILSATNHFAERMAVRKTWMQSSSIKSSNVVVRFFVALVIVLTCRTQGKR
ncbi:Hydroxyproline O-galactosyltransferase GALT2 [Linum grandiflorum]